MCDLISSGNWEKFRDDYGFPYIVNGDQWVGYDDSESIHQKVCKKKLKYNELYKTNDFRFSM